MANYDDQAEAYRFAANMSGQDLRAPQVHADAGARQLFARQEAERYERAALLRAHKALLADGLVKALGVSPDRAVSDPDYARSAARQLNTVEVSPGARADYLQTVPNWWNARQYAASVAARSGNESDFAKNRFLMSPQRAAWMRTVGRRADLLANLHSRESDDTDTAGSLMPATTAMHYWDRSSDAERSQRTRDDFNSPNYQRFSGRLPGSAAFLGTSISPVARGIQVSAILPNTLAFASESPSGFERSAREIPAIAADPVLSGLLALTRTPAALDQAGRVYHLQDRVSVVPELPVLDLPEPSNPMAAASRAQYRDRLAHLQNMHQNLAPPPDQHIANETYKAAQAAAGVREPVSAPAVAGDVLSFFRGAVDPTLLASLAAGPIAPIAAGVAQMGRAGVRATPGQIASAYAQLLPKQLQEEAVGEAVFTVPQQFAVSPQNRTFAQWLTAPAEEPPMPSRQDRDQAAREFDALHSSEPQSIRGELRNAFWSQVMQRLGEQVLDGYAVPPGG